MNWRDPHTDLVHVVNYGEDAAMAWSSRARQESGYRWMRCGHGVKVTRDGHLDRGFLVLAPFFHTEDMPTCLECVVWTPETTAWHDLWGDKE